MTVRRLSGDESRDGIRIQRVVYGHTSTGGHFFISCLGGPLFKIVSHLELIVVDSTNVLK